METTDVKKERPENDSSDSASGGGQGAAPCRLAEQFPANANAVNSRDEGALLLQRNILLEREVTALRQEQDEYHRSLVWILAREASKARRRLFKEGRLSGKLWSLFSRFVRTALAQGPSAAIGKVHEKIKRKLRSEGYLRSAGVSGGGVERLFGIKAPAGFGNLPWRFLGERSVNRPRGAGHFKVLLVSHSACRTGAPYCLLRLAQELTKVPDVDCWIVLKSGGDLADLFAQTAPTLQVSELLDLGYSPGETPGLVASLFRAMASQGMAVCNTMAVSEFHEAFAAHEIPVLSWIHELPTFMESFGGARAMEQIRVASRRVIVPANVVQDSLVFRFGFEHRTVRTIRYGLDPRTSRLDRRAMRSRVREELGLPEDALLVLGCGTVDMRKGADLFVQLARRVLLDPEAATVTAKTWFVWVGHPGDENLLRWLNHDAGPGQVEGRILFIGSRKDTVPYFMAADLFALTSREDPCPFANLEAMESGLAVVAFRESGGAPEVLGDAGICVPYIDVESMARATIALLQDGAARREKGRLGQEIVREGFTWPRFMQEFLEVLHSSYHYHPAKDLKVSVIVPNYRHAKYLEERLLSLFRQTRPPHEIIFLDDASPDDSLAVAHRLAQQSPVPMRIVANESNSGSTFRQWIKGLEFATGDLIWIAESDDCCRPEFLERLVPEFYDPDVVFAYCQSALIGSQGERLADNFLGHTDDISISRWRSAYRLAGVEEVELALSQKNTIPNASAAVFRMPQQLDFIQELTTLRFAGDWFCYAMLLRAGKISYLPEVLNFYRRHEQTVSHSSVRGDTHVQESLHVKARLFETFPVSANAIAHSLGRTVQEYDWLTEQFALKRPSLSENTLAAPWLLRICETLRQRVGVCSGLKMLLVLDDLEGGEACVTGIERANALASDHLVFLCNARPSRCDESMVARVASRVVFLEGTMGPTVWTSASPSPSPECELDDRRVRVLIQLLRMHQIDVVHTYTEEAERLVVRVREELNIPWFRHSPGADHPPAAGEHHSALPGMTVPRHRSTSVGKSV